MHKVQAYITQLHISEVHALGNETLEQRVSKKTKHVYEHNFLQVD